MPTPDDKAILTMDGWPGGVNNRIRETEQAAMREGVSIPSSQFLRKALNVDLTAEGHPIRRKGYALDSAGYTHSLFASLKLNLLCYVQEGLLTVGAASKAVNRYLRMSYCTANDSIYYSNGSDIGLINADGSFRQWGIPVAPAPTISGPELDNPKGWEDARQVAITYVDAYGREGGASEPVLAGGPGSFTVSIPMPLPPGVAEARVYVSEVGSEILYHAQTMLSSSTITIEPDTIGTGKELDTLNLKPPKAGQLLAYLNGRIYIARNDYVTFTEALRYHLTRPAQGIYSFSSDITLLEPSTDGIYVGTGQGVVFIAGNDPYDVQQTHVSPYAPIKGAVTRVPGEKFGVAVDELPVWWGADGVMVVGLPGGQLRQLTRDRLSVPKHSSGAVSIREQDGMSHIVSSLRKGEEANNMGATDTVVAEVRRNSIILNN